MAIKRIDQISCSLNLGLIYSLSYSYSPRDGVKITIFFVNTSGQYTQPNFLPLQKANIMIGNSSFSLYPVRSKISYASGRRVMSVDFVDDTFQLDWYYIALTGRAPNDNPRIFQLGAPVDNRTSQQKQATSLDPVAEQIAEFIEFPDIEYSFNDFISVLKQKFNVFITASVAANSKTPFDATLTNAYTGTFREVLDSWLNFYNLGRFFENGVIKIFDPTTLTINLPQQPVDAIEYEIEQDITSTYGKTVFNWFQQQGQELPLNQSSNSSNGPLYIRTNTLYNIGHEFGLQQPIIVNGVNIGTLPDINQVVAAAFGKEFWFLYNYQIGTAGTECGWSVVPYASINKVDPNVPAIIASLQSIGALVATVNQDVFEKRYNTYVEYGKSIAGRYYISDEQTDIAVDQQFQWFSQADGEIFDFVRSSSQQADMIFVNQPGTGPLTPGIVDGTTLSEYFPGINFVGGRMVYIDKFVADFSAFQLSPGTDKTLQTEANNTFASLFQGMDGTRSFDFSPFKGVTESADASPTNNYIAFGAPIFSQNMSKAFANVSALATSLTINNNPNPFLPRYTPSIDFVGISSTDYANLRSSTQESSNVQIVQPNQGPSVVSNTSLIKTIKQGSYSIFYQKYSQAKSASSTNNFFSYQFVPRQISSDIAINLSYTKNANNAYTLNRDLGTINQLVNNPLLPQLAQGRPFPTKRISFSLNYFYQIPVNFLTNGLVSMDISVGDAGITSSYTFSNEVLAVPNIDRKYEKFEQQIRNSYIRLHEANTVVS